MPYIDYAEWFRREQKRREQQQPVGVPLQSQIQTQTQPMPQAQTQAQMPTRSPSGAGVGPDTGYKSPRFGQIESEMGDYTKDVAIAAAEGYAKGGKVGAVINTVKTSAPYIARAGRRAWDAAKTGNAQNVSRSLAPVAPLFYGVAKLEKAGLPSWLVNPTWGGTKIISRIMGGTAPNLEKERWKRLEKYYGFTGLKPEWVDTKDAALKAQDKTLGADYVGYNDKGQWVNNKFANSGKDADLKAQDIQQFATNFETFGKEYSALPEEKKLQMMDIALRNGLVTEQKGTVDINWTPETYQEAANILFNDPNVQQFQAEQPRVYRSPTYVHPSKRK